MESSLIQKRTVECVLYGLMKQRQENSLFFIGIAHFTKKQWKKEIIISPPISVNAILKKKRNKKPSSFLQILSWNNHKHTTAIEPSFYFQTIDIFPFF